MSSPPPRDPGGPEAGPSKPRLEPGPSGPSGPSKPGPSGPVGRLETGGPSAARLEQAGPSMTRLDSGAGPSNTRPSSRPSVHPPSSSGRSFSSMLYINNPTDFGSRSSALSFSRGGDEKEGRGRGGGEEREGRSRIFNREKFLPKEELVKQIMDMGICR